MELKAIEVDFNKKETMDKFYKFYANTMIPSFDSDEIETYKQFCERIAQPERDNGSSYHILLIEDEESNICGGIVFDYLADTNTGFIEYIATSNLEKQKGIGTFTLKNAVEILNCRANKNGFDRLEFLCGEVEKEEVTGKKSKHYFWNKFGFEPLDFEYIQPPLDDDKKPVYIMNFGIITKVPGAEFRNKKIKKSTLKSIFEDYYRGEESPYMDKMLLKLDKTYGQFIEFKSERDYER